jgi:hypothetical protein
MVGSLGGWLFRQSEINHEERTLDIAQFPLIVQPNRESGWQLVVMAGTAFDYSTPFRSTLVEIAEALGAAPETDLRLPPYEEDEDFVEGTLRLSDDLLGVYFEHSLSYLAIMSDNEGVLREVAQRLQAVCVVPSQ